MNSKATHFVLPRAEFDGKHAMVKTRQFFIDEGGLSQDWGKHWVPVIADGIDHARLLAWFMGSGTPFPRSIAFSPPNTMTVGEILKEDS